MLERISASFELGQHAAADDRIFNQPADCFVLSHGITEPPACLTPGTS